MMVGFKLPASGSASGSSSCCHGDGSQTHHLSKGSVTESDRFQVFLHQKSTEAAAAEQRGRGGGIMPKKTKKGGGKTEEERRLYQEQGAQAEEEMAKKKEEILTLFLKDKLQKEERNTAVNLLKLNEGWRSILRQTRAPELRHDITVLSQVFERHLDSLDSTIKNLEQDLQEAEHQAARTRRVHLQHLERLWAQQEKRLMFVQQQWENSLQHLSSRFNSERKQMLANSEEQQADLEEASFTVEQQHQAPENPSYDVVSMNMERLWLGSRKDKISMMEKTKKMQKCMQLCSDMGKDLETAIAKNRLCFHATNKDMKKAKKLQEAVLRLRSRLKASRTDSQLEVQNPTDTRNQLNKKTRKLRQQLTQAQTAVRKQLTDLTVQSDNATKKLRTVIAKGERVLRAAEICHKLENKQKNISPTLFSTEEHRPEEPAEEESGDCLQQVIGKMSAAVLQREALKTHRNDLRRENQQLRLLLQQHLDTMTVHNADAAFDRCHALLSVCQAPIAAAPPDTNRRHTVNKVIHVVKHKL